MALVADLAISNAAGVYWAEMNLENGFDIHHFFGIARVSMKEHQAMIAEAFKAYLNLEEETEDA